MENNHPSTPVWRLTYDKAPSHLTFNGYTTDKKIVVGGVFIFVNSFGIPVDLTVDYLRSQNMVIDWEEFVKKALDNHWKPSTIVERICECFPNLRETIELLVKACVAHRESG